MKQNLTVLALFLGGMSASLASDGKNVTISLAQRDAGERLAEIEALEIS